MQVDIHNLNSTPYQFMFHLNLTGNLVFSVVLQMSLVISGPSAVYARTASLRCICITLWQSEQYACAIFARFERLQWDLSNYNSQLVIGKTGRHADSQSVGWRCCSTLLRLQRLTICLDRETGEYSGAEESNLVKLYWQEATAKNARHRRLGKEQKCSKCLCSLPRESEGEEALDAI